MSAEDSPAATDTESNDEQRSDALLSGIILIPQENDESEEQGEEETESKYVIHEVMVEIMESDDEMKPDIKLLDKELANGIPTEEKDINENMMIDEDSAPDITLEQVKDVNVIMMLDENTTPDISSEEAKDAVKITVLDKDSVPDITLDQAKNVIEITVLEENSAPVITLDKVKEVNGSLVLDKEFAPDNSSGKVEVFKNIKNSMMLDENAACDTISEALKKSKKSIVSNRKTLTQDSNHLAENTDERIDKAIEDSESIFPEHIDTYYEPRQLRPIIEERVMPPVGLKSNVQLFTEDNGPQLYKAKGALVTAPIITKNLPMVFNYLPIHGKPHDSSNLNEYFSHKIREFVGCGLTDYEFKQLEDYCSPEQLKTGNEIEMETNVPVMGVVDVKILENFDPRNKGNPPDLCILKKNKLRIEKDTKSLFIKKLKYRGVRNLPFTQEMYHMPLQKPNADSPDVDLEPGKDILYRVRVYRPFVYNQTKDRFTRTRHSVFCCDIMLTGRNKLSDLRDRFVCHNDFDMRVDVSNHPDMLPSAKAKEVFPSGFLFINNVFYVDTREGCVDYSEPIREWARKKDLGVFPKKDMCAVRLEDLTLKLGYPEVYVHQGNCEHVFLFSEIRLLNPTDPLRLYNYPCSTAIAQNQTVYCTTCAEFSAKWIVVGCNRVPFDPAFFCDTCFRQYLYIDGQKIGEFKAYSYRGNALNVLKPQ